MTCVWIAQYDLWIFDVTVMKYSRHLSNYSFKLFVCVVSFLYYLFNECLLCLLCFNLFYFYKNDTWTWIAWHIVWELVLILICNLKPITVMFMYFMFHVNCMLITDKSIMCLNRSIWFVILSCSCDGIWIWLVRRNITVMLKMCDLRNKLTYLHLYS